ncbi:hypothetical protein Tco_1027173 [Tanacetum coccineum]
MERCLYTYKGRMGLGLMGLSMGLGLTTYVSFQKLLNELTTIIYGSDRHFRVPNIQEADKLDLEFYKEKYHQLRHLKLLGLFRLDRGSVLILSSNWFPLMRVKWLPLMANSFCRVQDGDAKNRGVRATTRSAAHMGSSSMGLRS